MVEIEFYPLRYSGREIHVSWTLRPDPGFYHRNALVLDLGMDIPAGALPERFLWNLIVYALHTHWLFLGDCQVVLPVRLSQAEIDLWLRLAQVSFDTLGYHARQDTSSPVRPNLQPRLSITCNGTEVESYPPVDLDRTAAATLFSGGKESLCHAGFLAEHYPATYLVWHRHSFAKSIPKAVERIPELLNCGVVITRSDVREIVNGRCLHQELGFHPNLLISSMVHTLQATLAMLGYGCRIPLLLHGSEYEANTYRCDDDKVVFDETGLYDAVHQKVLEHYLRSLGDFRFTSLLYPLSNFQTQSLLLRRYPHLVSVQGSCFFGSGEWCSTCPKCFRIAAIMLANGQDPAQYGIEMAKLIRHVYRHIRQDIQAVQRGQTGKMTPNIYRALQIIKDRRSPELTRMMAGANGWPGLYSRVLWAYLLRTVDPHLDFRDVDQYHPALMALCTVRDQVEALYLSLWETGPTDRSEQYQTLQNLIDSVCGVESA